MHQQIEQERSRQAELQQAIDILCQQKQEQEPPLQQPLPQPCNKPENKNTKKG
jgi:hypothetical protein